MSIKILSILSLSVSRQTSIGSGLNCDQSKGELSILLSFSYNFEYAQISCSEEICCLRSNFKLITLTTPKVRRSQYTLCHVLAVSLELKS